MRENGVVEAVEGGEALVKIKRHAACLGCGACSLSSDGGMSIKAVAPEGVKVGDRVALEIDSASIVKAAALVYLSPAVAFIIGVYLGLKIFGNYVHKEVISVLIGSGLLAAALFLARAYGKSRRKIYQAKIVREET